MHRDLNVLKLFIFICVACCVPASSFAAGMPLAEKCSSQRFLGPDIGVSQVYSTSHDGVGLRVMTIENENGMFVRMLEYRFKKAPNSTSGSTRDLLLQRLYADGCRVMLKTPLGDTVVLDLSEKVWMTKLPIQIGNKDGSLTKPRLIEVKSRISTHGERVVLGLSREVIEVTTDIPATIGQKAFSTTTVFVEGIGMLGADISRLSGIEKLAPFELKGLLKQVGLE